MLLKQLFDENTRGSVLDRVQLIAEIGLKLIYAPDIKGAEIGPK